MHQSHFELWSFKHLGCHLQIPSLRSIFSVSPPSLLNCKSHQNGESGLLRVHRAPSKSKATGSSRGTAWNPEVLEGDFATVPHPVCIGWHMGVDTRLVWPNAA